jgi:folate-binding protein YgfZ
MKEKNHAANALRGFIRLSGEDSTTFLQGQVTCDMESLTLEQEIYGAHCSPKGRVIFLFCARMTAAGDILLATHPSIVDIAIASLSKYAVFFKTKITDVTGLESIDNPNQTELERISCGHADITAETTEMFIPQMLNLDILNYISFRKGCYTGQEVVARAHYRGAVKRRMHYLLLACETAPSAGETLSDNDSKPLGHIVNAAVNEDNQVEALAVLSEDALTYDRLTVGDKVIPVSYLTLPYQIPE